MTKLSFLARFMKTLLSTILTVIIASTILIYAQNITSVIPQTIGDADGWSIDRGWYQDVNDKINSMFSRLNDLDNDVNSSMGAQAKAWVQFGPTGNILASYNVSSVTRTSAGYFTVNFTTPMSSENYAVMVSTTNLGYSAGMSEGIDPAAGSQGTGSVKIFTMLASNVGATTPYDFPTTSVVVYSN